MVDGKKVDVILNVTTDKNGAITGITTLKGYEEELKRMGKSADTVSQRLAGISRESRIERIGEQFGKMAIKIKDTDRAAELLEKRLAQIGATEPEIARATSAFASRAGVGESGGARLSPYLATLGRDVKALPAIRIPGAGALSTDAVAKMVGLLGSLPPIAGAAIPILGGVATAFIALETVTSKAKDSLNNAIAANKAYYDLLAKGAGLDEGKKRLEELQRIQDAQQKELANIDRANAAAFNGAVEQFGTKVGGDFGARIVFGLGQISTADDELAKRHDELTKSMAENKNEIEGITRAINDGTLASNDYKKALEEEAKIKRDAALAGANDEYQKQLKLQQEGLMSSSQLMSKITESIQQQNAAQAALNELQADKARGVIGPEIDKQITEFQLQIGRLGADITRLYGEFADRKAIEDAIQKEKDLAAARKDLDKINSDVNKATEKYGDDLEALADKYRKSSADLKAAFASANLEAEIDRQEKLADLATQNNDKQVEAQQKYNDEREKIEEDYRKRVKEIEREYTRSSAQAIQDRDAVALDAAKQKRKDELEDAQGSRRDNLAEREKEYRAELRQLQKNNADRIAEINRDFQRQYEQRLRKYNADQQALLNNAIAERAARTDAYNKQLTDLKNFLQARLSADQGMYSALLNYAATTKLTLDHMLNGTGYSGDTGGGIGASGAHGPVLSAYADGGFVKKTGPALVHQGELILNRRQQQAMGGVNLTINGMGMNRNAVVKEATRVLNNYFDEYDRAG